MAAGVPLVLGEHVRDALDRHQRLAHPLLAAAAVEPVEHEPEGRRRRDGVTLRRRRRRGGGGRGSGARARRQHVPECRVAERGRDDRGVLVEHATRVERRAQLLLGREVALVGEDDVRRLDLLQQQLGHRPVDHARVRLVVAVVIVVVCARVRARQVIALARGLHRAEQLGERVRVDERHLAIDGDVAEAEAVLHIRRVRDAAQLDYNVVERRVVALEQGRDRRDELAGG